MGRLKAVRMMGLAGLVMSTFVGARESRGADPGVLSLSRVEVETE